MMKTATIHHVSPLSGHAYTNVEAQEMNIKESLQPLYRISRLYVPIIFGFEITIGNVMVMRIDKGFKRLPNDKSIAVELFRLSYLGFVTVFSC